MHLDIHSYPWKSLVTVNHFSSSDHTCNKTDHSKYQKDEEQCLTDIHR